MIFWCTTQRPHFIIISDRHRHIELLSDIAKKPMDARWMHASALASSGRMSTSGYKPPCNDIKKTAAITNGMPLRQAQ